MTASNSGSETSGSTEAVIGSASDLLERRGIIPFVGLTPGNNAEYPEGVNTGEERFDDSESTSFQEAFQVLPQAEEGELWAENLFVETDGSTLSVDTEALRNTDGLDIDRIEELAGESLDSIVESQDPDPLVQVESHKDIIDKRRLALHTLGFKTKFRWQIASDSYNPGDMRQFFEQKIEACRKNGAREPFGWIRHHDWGGSTVVTCIYPSMKFSINMPDDLEVDFDGKITVVDNPEEQAFEEEQNESQTTIYYGDRMGYGFRGAQTIWAYPVVFIPSVSAMIPLPGPRFSRRHRGKFMDETHERDEGRKSPVEWHAHILDKLDSISGEVSKDVMRARLAALDFGEYPFSVAEFYEFLGIPSKYASEAAERAISLAKFSGYDCPHDGCDVTHESLYRLRWHSAEIHDDEIESPENSLSENEKPTPVPTVWNLQLSLKLALLDHFNGARAKAQFQEYQEVAGQLLRHPAQQVQIALQEYEMQSGSDDEEGEVVDPDQQTLAESLDDIMDLPGVSEENLELNEAEQVGQRVQQRLDAQFGNGTASSEA